jgi:putrescine aminotransferase
MEGISKIGRNFPGTFEKVRGKGLLIGMEFTSNEKGYAVASGLFKRGVLVAGTMINSKTIRVEPPLTISREMIDRVLEILSDVLEGVEKGD